MAENNILTSVGIAALVMFASFGGLPTPPRFFEWFTKNVPFVNKVFQFLFFALLVYLTLNREFKQSAIAATVIFALFEAIKLIEDLYFP